MVDQYPVAVSTRGPSGETNAYVVGTTNGLLVDPAGATGELREACAGGVDHVAVTHHHPDHVGGVAELAADYDLTVWARRGRESAFEAATGISPDRTYGSTDRLAIAGGVTLFDTPGHAPEHTAFVSGETILTGDLVVATGSVVVGAPDGDMRAYLSSLRRLAARDATTLSPGHGPVIEEPRATCERLIRHRRRREHRVLTAIRSGNRSVDTILDAAYKKDIAGVADLARATVLAHIEKLAVERKIEWDGQQAVPA